MPTKAKRNQVTQTPPLQRPNQPDLLQIVLDLQKRVRRLEAKTNTH